ncbi:asparagine-linked glycosylation 13, partial [Catenaria anguillulae PL171]
VFVTVGTTTFPALIAAVLSTATQLLLATHGYTHMVIQAGRSLADLMPISTDMPLAVTAYDYKPSLASDMERADLIISHAGAGCMIEALRSGRHPGKGQGNATVRQVIVVVNDQLMDNHQDELARALHGLNYLVSCLPGELSDAIHMIHTIDLAPFPAQDVTRFPQLLQQTIL